MKNEYGGYLPIEISKKSKAFYEGYSLLSFNCARNAILYTVERFGFEKVYLPVYLCTTVAEVLEEHSISYYHINTYLDPDLEKIEKNAVIIIPNYFGIKKNKTHYLEKYNNVIFDNTQAFFEEPVLGAFNVYSCRKFFGVTDGAYLISDLLMDADNNEYERYQPKFSGYLLDSITYGTNNAYKDSLKNEEQLSNDGIRRFSILSEMLLEQIDYGTVIKRRKENYHYLSENLGIFNELKVVCQVDVVPMVYPLLIKKRGIREALINAHIYVPCWWKAVAENKSANEYERYLSDFLLPLPIDQRYTINDMNDIVDIVKQVLKEN